MAVCIAMFSTRVTNKMPFYKTVWISITQASSQWHHISSIKKPGIEGGGNSTRLKAKEFPEGAHVNSCKIRSFVVVCKFVESFHCYLHHTVQTSSRWGIWKVTSNSQSKSQRCLKRPKKKIISLNRRPSVINRNSGSTLSTIDATKSIANFRFYNLPKYQSWVWV